MECNWTEHTRSSITDYDYGDFFFICEWFYYIAASSGYFHPFCNVCHLTFHNLVTFVMFLSTMSGKMENYTAKECGEWSNQWCTEHYKYKYYILVENWGITRRLKGGAAKEVNGEERGIMGGTTDREGVMSWSFPTRCFTFFLYLLASSIFFGRFPT